MKLLTLLLLGLPLFANPFYHWPVQGTRVITGSFGEFRRYSFHMGTDFATEGKEGVPILALTKGKVIKLQSYRYGIGNAVWLEQEDGFISRYGHLQRFSDRILNSIENQEIKEKIFFRQDFEYIFPSETQPTLKAGEILGYSGKTGLGPPHLHIDLIHGETHYNLADFLDTSFLSTQILADYVELIPLDNKSFINGKNQNLKIKFEPTDSNFYTYVERVPVFIQGKIALKVAASEITKSGNRLGMKNIVLRVDDVLLQEIDFTKIYKPHVLKSCFIFDNYQSNMNGKPFLYYLYSRENSELENLRFSQKQNGILNSEILEENSDYLVQIQLTGITKKKITLSFRIKKDIKTYPKTQNLFISPNVFPNLETKITSKDQQVQLLFTKDSIFVKNYFSVFENESIRFEHSELKYLSKIYTILPDYREFNQGYKLYFSFDKKQIHHPEKTGLFLLNSNGIPYKLIAKLEKNSPLITTLSYTGHFALLEDHSPPQVWLEKLKSGKKYKPDIAIFIKAQDLGSGLNEESIQGSIDGQKAYFDYDPDLQKWELFYPEIFKQEGRHVLEYWGRDKLGNESGKEIFEYTIEK